VTDEGKFLVIVRKHEAGDWQASVSIYNSDAPMPTMDIKHSEGGEHP
jgi:hypothetical protein